MRQVIWFWLALSLIVVESLALAHVWLSDGPVLLSEPNDSKQVIAQVVMRRDFPYLSTQAYLEIRAADSGALRQRHFLLARDAFQDLASEIRSLEWRDGTVALDIRSSHYSGSGLFDVS
jgi:hypothetical protein